MSLAEKVSLCAFIRDPVSVFVYWDSTVLTAIAAENSETENVSLEVKYQDGSAEKYLIHPGSESWYLTVPQETKFEISLVMRFRSGRISTISSTEYLSMPSCSVCDTADPEWYISKNNFNRLFMADDYSFLSSSGSFSGVIL